MGLAIIHEIPNIYFFSSEFAAFLLKDLSGFLISDYEECLPFTSRGSFCLRSVSTETASEPEFSVQVSFQNLQTQQADNKQGRKQGASREGGGGRSRL